MSQVSADELPELSVILLTPDDFRTIRRTMRHLRAQTARERIEVVIVAPSRAGLGAAPEELEGFRRCVVVEVGEVSVVARAKAAGVWEARAPFVAFAEDHCFPAPGWAGSLIKAHREGWAAVGPAMRNANPRTMISWAGLLLHFGCCVEPAATGEAQSLPWHNTSYRRDLLTPYGDALASMLIVEGMLFDELKAAGHKLYFEQSAAAYHVNISRLSSWVTHAFWGGRLFGATRARQKRWTRRRRLLYACAAPLIPPLRLWRALGDIRRKGLQRELVPRVLPAMLAGLIPHAVGEAAGYALGVGSAERRYSYFEVARTRHVTDEDRRDLES
ncbi:MAG TPA: glycosyltransferase family A protein [Pyrinomonadaceae bacterium]|nr:glycosyltransferase family A protein [Pyrinomonadaceae bacterium]